MIHGTVNAYREATILLRVYGPQRQELDIEAVVDTGFDGSLSLPQDSVALLGLPFRRRGRVFLADGREPV